MILYDYIRMCFEYKILFLVCRLKFLNTNYLLNAVVLASIKK